MAGLGKPGVIPKRSDQRVRRNKTGEDGLAIDSVPMTGVVEAPELEFEGIGAIHPLTQDLWDSLPDSGQTRFWEPSDWQYARIALFTLNQMLVAGKISAMKLAAVDTMLSKLLLTEGDRRRVKIEVQRVEAEGKLIDASSMFDRMFEMQCNSDTGS